MDAKQQKELLEKLNKIKKGKSTDQIARELRKKI